MEPRRVLVVSYHAPQLDRDSGARRIFHLIELLRADGWEPSFLAADGVGDAHDVLTLERAGVAVYDGYRDAIDDVLSDGPFELALIAFWLNAERYLPAMRTIAPDMRVIVDSVDVHFVRESRKVFQRIDGRSSEGLSASHAARFAAELNTYAGADAVLTVSQKEADLLNDLLNDPALASAVPDFEDPYPAPKSVKRRKGVVCVGSFQHLPNIDAVEYLCRDVLPLVDPELLARHPVWIVGNDPTERVQAAARSVPNARLVGWVPSVEPYLQNARVSVVPLLYGAGTKRKTIQSLLAGTPTVSTSIGVEGLDVRHGEHVLVADDAGAFAAAITTLLTDDKLAGRLSRAGHAQVSERHARPYVASALRAAIDGAFDRRPKRTVFRPLHAAATQRVTMHEYATLVRDIGTAVRSVLPSSAQALVVSRGDDSLLDLGCAAGHFPRDETGAWAGYHPGDSADAIEHLRAAVDSGTQYLVFPQTAFWWFEHYREFATHLETTARQIHSDDTCIIFRLGVAASEHRAVPGANGQPQRAVYTRPRSGNGNGNGSGESGTGPRAIAFYLPQFHPIPQNDLWWGEGFTEWRNVSRGTPQFDGHYQPHVPADLGFYDLRLPEVRAQQAELAGDHGVHGFCYYHYWFDSTRLLERPFEEVLRTGEPDFPFCLCWANDPWSRKWNGRTDSLLQDQTYSPEDDLTHIRWLLPALADPRAITVDGRPMFLVYRSSHLPDPERTCDTWRREAERAGLPGLHLVAIETAWDLGWDATRFGFDAKVLFQPQFGWLMGADVSSRARRPIPGLDELQVYDYETVAELTRTIEPVSYRRYESVVPGWDNTARVGARAVVLDNATPEAYERWLSDVVDRVRGEPPEHQLVFINAWNEWAEGCHLEPDQRWGHGFLEATARALQAHVPAGRPR